MLTGVGVVAGGRQLLRKLDWTVSHGQRWVVVGPNGAGKSTLLGVAGAWRLPSSGTAEVLGARLGTVDMRALRRRVGFTSAELERRLDARLSVREAVLSGREARLTRGPAGRAPDAAGDALLDEFGLTTLAGRRVTSLSEGERRRMWLARSLVNAPELLLADEPAAGLDIAGREHLVGVLERLAASDLSALVLVSHHLEEVPPGFTHALLLREGTAVAAGPITEVLTDGPLSACYGMALRVTRADGRLWVRRVGRAGATG